VKHLILAVLFGLVFCTPLIWSQTSGFSQQGKVTHDLRDEGFFIAHSSLPLNSKARIVNPSTGKEIEVTITRLIPASSSRIADVSSGVWQELGLTPNTDVRIYTTVSARPQPAAPQNTIASQTAGSQTAGSQTNISSQPTASQTSAPQTSAPQTTASSTARTVQTGTASNALDNMPSGVKFENNNNFIINGNPAGVPSATAYETRTQTPQSAAPYETQPAKPVVTYEPRPAQPAEIIDSWPQPAQPVVTYEPRPQPVQPAVIIDDWPQSAMTYETRPTQPVAANETRLTQGVSDIWAQIAMPAGLYEMRTQTAQRSYETRVQQAPVHEDTPSVNEVLAAASRTFVFIDSPVGAPKPSVTINNGTLSNMPPVPNEMRQQQAQSAVSYVSTPAHSNVKIENWPSQPDQRAVTSETRTLPNQPAVTFETRTIEVPVDQAGTPLWDGIPTPGNEVFSPLSNSRVFIDAPPNAVRPSVIINNASQPYWPAQAGGTGER
jgi:hypothetical protein